MRPTAPASRPLTIYLAWNSFQRRQVSMAPEVGFECVFLPLPSKPVGRLRKSFAWASLFLRSLHVLHDTRPATVWLQLPHVPLLWAVLLHRAFFDQSVVLIADCHNAMFRAPWSRVPFGLTRLARCDHVLVHNEAVLQQAIQLGVPSHHLRVLEDVPMLPQPVGPGLPAPTWLAARPRPWVIFPGSFAADEPIAEVLEAARLLPKITVIITGKLANAARHGHSMGELPSNVLTPGFLPLDEFDILLATADAVLGLTKVEGIQLSVCNEALGHAKPLVTSDTVILRRLFGDAAVMVKNTGPAIADGLQLALADAQHLSKASAALAIKRRTAWAASYAATGLPPLPATVRPETTA